VQSLGSTNQFSALKSRTIPHASSTLIIRNSCSPTNRSRKFAGTEFIPPRQEKKEKKVPQNRSRKFAGTKFISNQKIFPETVHSQRMHAECYAVKKEKGPAITRHSVVTSHCTFAR
jgi:hypothetical protein